MFSTRITEVFMLGSRRGPDSSRAESSTLLEIQGPRNSEPRRRRGCIAAEAGETLWDRNPELPQLRPSVKRKPCLRKEGVMCRFQVHPGGLLAARLENLCLRSPRPSLPCPALQGTRSMPPGRCSPAAPRSKSAFSRCPRSLRCASGTARGTSIAARARPVPCVSASNRDPFGVAAYQTDNSGESCDAVGSDRRR